MHTPKQIVFKLPSPFSRLCIHAMISVLPPICWIFLFIFLLNIQRRVGYKQLHPSQNTGGNNILRISF